MAADNTNNGKIKRLAATDEEYYRKEWRSWAWSHLWTPAAGKEPTGWGPLLYGYLDGNALLICKKLTIGDGGTWDLTTADGFLKLFHVLDLRFPELQLDEKRGDAMDHFYDFKPDKAGKATKSAAKKK